MQFCVAQTQLARLHGTGMLTLVRISFGLLSILSTVKDALSPSDVHDTRIIPLTLIIAQSQKLLVA